MHGWETRMLLRHSLQRGVSKAALARRFGVEPPDDPRMGRDGSVGPGPVVRGWAILATSSRAPQAGSLHRDRRGTSRGVPRSVGDASVRRGPRGGLPRWLQPCAGLRPRGTPARAGRGGGAAPAGRQGQVDFATFTRPWGRRHALVVVLSHSRLLWLRFYRPTDDGGADRGAGARVRAVRRCPDGALVRPDARGRAVGRPRGWRRTGVERGVSARCRALGVPPARVPAVSAQTKGKVSGRSATSATASSTGARSRTTRTSPSRRRAGWEGTANVRRHSTTGERPVDRFERDEREALGPLARRPYQRFGVQPATEPTRRRVPNTVKVERRSLRVYADAAG